jgi:hypothetical protein
LISASVFSACAAFIKGEGLAISAVMTGALILYVLSNRPARGWTSLAKFAAVWLVLAGPWLLFQQTLPMEPAIARHEWSRMDLIQAIYDFPLVARYFLQDAANIMAWGLLWVLWIVVSVAGRHEIIKTPIKYVYLIVLGALFLDFLAVSIAPVSHPERAYFESRTPSRLLFHVAPLVVFLTAQLLPQSRSDT